MLLLCLKSAKAFEDYVVHPSLQSHAVSLVIFSTGSWVMPLLRTFWEGRKEKGWKTALYVEILRTGYLNWCFQLSNWCDSFSVPLMIFYVRILVKYFQTAPPCLQYMTSKVLIIEPWGDRLQSCLFLRELKYLSWSSAPSSSISFTNGCLLDSASFWNHHISTIIFQLTITFYVAFVDT